MGQTYEPVVGYRKVLAERVRLVVDTVTSIDPAGDSAAPSGLPYRMGCQAAVQLGPQAAETVLSRIAGHQPATIEVGFAGQCISLGRRVWWTKDAKRQQLLQRGAAPGIAERVES